MTTSGVAGDTAVFLRRYPVLAFVICLLLSYSAEEFFGVADIRYFFGLTRPRGLALAATRNASLSICV